MVAEIHFHLLSRSSGGAAFLKKLDNSDLESGCLVCILPANTSDDGGQCEGCLVKRLEFTSGEVSAAECESQETGGLSAGLCFLLEDLMFASLFAVLVLFHYQMFSLSYSELLPVESDY